MKTDIMAMTNGITYNRAGDDASVSGPQGRHLRFWLRARSALASACIASAFLSLPVLADEYTCRYKDRGTIEYSAGGKSNTADISIFTERLGKILHTHCSGDDTILVLEKGLVKTGGGKAVIETGSTSIYHPDVGKYKVADVEEFDGFRAVAGESKWGSVAAVVGDDRTVRIFKGLERGMFARVVSPEFSEINFSDMKLRIGGTPQTTYVEVRSGGHVISITVSGTTKDDISISDSVRKEKGK